MKSSTKKVLLGAAVFLSLTFAGFLIYVAMQPAEFHIARSRTIAASPDELRPYFEDLQQWGTWNPWDELDPNMDKEYSDPPHGEGAWYTWQGDENVGKGKMTITKVEPGSVTYHLEFIEPFASEADTTITFEASAEGTQVVWSMDGQNDFPGKLMSVLMDMDAMIGADFEKGLTKLEGAVEGAEKGPSDS